MVNPWECKLQEPPKKQGYNCDITSMDPYLHDRIHVTGVTGKIHHLSSLKTTSIH